jgi:hypothetical protein
MPNWGVSRQFVMGTSSTLEQAIVILVITNPHPNQPVFVIKGNCSVVKTYTGSPKLTDLFQSE